MTRSSLFSLALAVVLCVFPVFAQTTAFTYQGSFNVGGVPATGSYDLEFRLFDAVSGGAQQGSTLQRPNVAVANGIFVVSLDFGAGALPGADRYLDIAVRNSGGGAFTPLAPRQPLTSAPYAVKSVKATNSDQLAGVAAANYLQTNGSGSGLTNLNASSVNSGILAVGYGGTGVTASGPTGNFLRSNSINWASSPILAADIPAGSGHYIQNTTSLQGASFNISGSGTAGGTFSGNFVNAGTQYNMRGTALIRQEEFVFDQNLYVGDGTGGSSSSTGNTYVGVEAGKTNGGSGNSIFGSRAGGSSNTSNASIFGYGAGEFSGGDGNSIFGQVAGRLVTGNGNSIFGTNAASGTLTGNGNSFFGLSAGGSGSGSENTAIGLVANVATNLSNATAIGARATVGASNSLVLGSINGVNNASADTSVGIGTTTPNQSSRLHVNGNVRVTNGYVYITNPNTAIITSPNGACWGITVNNSGALSTFPVNPCP